MQYINIHTHTQIDSSAVELINAELFRELEENTKYSIGFHPWDIDSIDTLKSLNWVKENAAKEHIVAIGEIGLDRAISTSLESQIEIYLMQLHIAEEVNKPIIIHCVKAYSDYLNLLKLYPPKVPVIFHGFNANLDIANKLIEKGAFLSFGKALLNSEKLQNVFAKINLDKVFFETDNSDLKIDEVYEKAAKLNHICIHKLKQKVFNNFIKVFGDT